MVHTKVYTASYKLCSFQLSTHLGTMNLYMILYRNLTAASCVIFITGIASIHLVNKLIAMNKNLNPPSALGKTPTILLPQIATIEERSICQRGFACFVVCLLMN
jgi:hypothetical protein